MTTRKVAVPAREKRECWVNTIGHKFDSTCQAKCGAPITVFDYEAGHIVAASQGGSNEASNLKPICSVCNKEMGSENMNDYIIRKKRPLPAWMAVKFALKDGHIIVAYARSKAPASSCYVELGDKVGILVDVSNYPFPLASADVNSSSLISFAEEGTIRSAPYSTIYEHTEARPATWEDILSGKVKCAADIARLVMTATESYGTKISYGNLVELKKLCESILPVPITAAPIGKGHILTGEIEPLKPEEATALANSLGLSASETLLFTDADLIREFKATHRLNCRSA